MLTLTDFSKYGFRAASDVPTARARFCTGQNLAWNVLARVGGKTSVLFRKPYGVNNATNAQQDQILFTFTHITVNLQAGGAIFVLDFSSLVRSNDLLRQSLPYSYLTVPVKTHGSAIDVFSAIDDFWTARQGKVQAAFENIQGTRIYTINGTLCYIGPQEH